MRENQASLKPNRDCRNQLFTLRQILKQRCQYNRPTVMTFIDFKAALDSVERCIMWNVCSSLGLEEVMINLLRALYDETYCSIKAYNTSSPYQFTGGVRRGSILSPLFLVIVIDWALREAAQGRIFEIQLNDYHL